MKIAFVISTLSVGGAERVAAILCNRWAEQHHSVSLITFENAAAPSHYALHPGIEKIPLDLLRANSGPAMLAVRSAQRILRLRSAIKRLAPDIIVSFIVEQNVLTVLSARGLGIPIVVSERVHPGYHAIGRMRSLARRLVYPRASAVVVQTAEIARWIKQNLRIPGHVISNPIELEPFAAARQGHSSPQHTRHKAIAVGRLKPQKGFDILLQAFAQIASKHSGWDLIIYGEGDQRACLIRLRDRLALTDRVFLPGVTDKVAAELGSADLFVHPARYEGFPNAVVEALASSCCVLATDSPGGTAEILYNGTYGMLVPPNDTAALAAGLDALMGNPAMRQGYAERAANAVLPLSSELIAAEWIDLFEELLAGNRIQGKRVRFGWRPRPRQAPVERHWTDITAQPNTNRFDQ